MFTNVVAIPIVDALFRGGFTDEASNQLLLVDSSNGLIRKFNMDTYQRVEPYLPLSNITPLGVAMISAASSVTLISSSPTMDISEISGGYRYTIPTGGGNGPFQSGTQAKGQQIAADPAAKIGFAIASAATMTRINGNTFTLSVPPDISFKSGTVGSAVIYKEPGRFLAASSGGEIVEINLQGGIVRRMFLSNENTTGDQLNQMNPRIVSLAYDNNIVIATTETGQVVCIDWTTLTPIRTTTSAGAAQGTLMSNSASGFVVMCPNSAAGTINKVAVEVDFTTSNLATTDTLYLASPGQIVDLGINTQTGRGWIIQQVTTTAPLRAILYFFDLVVRPSTTRTITVNNNGVSAKSRVILADLVSSTVYLDTYSSSPATYRVPTGKTILELIKVGNGTTALWDLSQYST